MLIGCATHPVLIVHLLNTLCFRCISVSSVCTYHAKLNLGARCWSAVLNVLQITENVHAGAFQVGFFTPGETKWRLRNVASSASRLRVRGFLNGSSRADQFTSGQSWDWPFIINLWTESVCRVYHRHPLTYTLSRWQCYTYLILLSRFSLLLLLPLSSP